MSEWPPGTSPPSDGSTCRPLVRLGYLNVAGLDLVKWQYLVHCLDPARSPPSSPSMPPPDLSLDILFVAEHWFTTFYKSIYLPSPYTCAATPLVKKQTKTHDGGGILMLVAPWLQSKISSVSVSGYSIRVSLSLSPGLQQTICAVYFPPSLSLDAVTKELDQMDQVDVLLGDVNVKYPHAPWLQQDTASSTKERRALLDQFCQHASLTHLMPSSGQSRNDHAYARTSSLAVLYLVSHPAPPPSMSDHHPWIVLELPLLEATQCGNDYLETSVKLQRFYIRCLDHPVVEEHLWHAYEEQYGAMDQDELVDLAESLIVDPPLHCQTDMDRLDAMLTKRVSDLCDRHLGSFDPSAPAHHAFRPPASFLDQDLREKHASGPVSEADIIQYVKQSHRQERQQRRITSRDPTVTPLEDAVLYFREMYASDACEEMDVEASERRYLSGLDHELVWLMNGYQVYSAIKRYPLNRSPGQDGIQSKILKCLSQSKAFINHLSLLFRACVITCITPQRWNESIIFPIPKQGKDCHWISDGRPLSLTVMFRRIFESILINDITYSDSHVPLRSFNGGQAGFRRHFSTLTHALVSHDASLFGYNHRVFLDIRQAYDRVPLPLVWKKLEKRGISKKYLEVLRSLFDRTVSRCVINHQLSVPFGRSRGLFQGSLLSPWLFNVFIDDLAEELNGSQLDPPVALFFADDIQLLAKTAEDLLPLMDTVKRWMLDNQMEINESKSAYVGPSPLGALGLPAQDAYKYLGIPHEANGLAIESLIQLNVEKATKVLNYFRYTSSLDRLSEVARLYCYKAYIRPVLEYGAPIMFHYLDSLPCLTLAGMPKKRKRRKEEEDPRQKVASLWKALEAVQDAALAWIFSTRAKPPILRSISGLGHLQDRFAELAARFTYHLETMAVDNPGRSMILRMTSQSPPDASFLLRSRMTLLRIELEAHHPFTLRPSSMDMTLFFARRRLEILEAKWKLPARIPFDVRRPPSFLDPVICIPSKKIRCLAIKWRTNIFGQYCRCSVCNTPYTSSHIQQCRLLSVPSVALDLLLNNGEYQAFFQLATELQSKLTRLRS